MWELSSIPEWQWMCLSGVGIREPICGTSFGMWFGRWWSTTWLSNWYQWFQCPYILSIQDYESWQLYYETKVSGYVVHCKYPLLVYGVYLGDIPPFDFVCFVFVLPCLRFYDLVLPPVTYYSKYYIVQSNFHTPFSTLWCLRHYFLTALWLCVTLGGLWYSSPPFYQEVIH